MASLQQERGGFAVRSSTPPPDVNEVFVLDGDEYIKPMTAVAMIMRATNVNAVTVTKRLQKRATDGALRSFPVHARLRFYHLGDVLAYVDELTQAP